MSANLLDGIKPKLLNGATKSDGIISIAANTGSERNAVGYAIPGQSALSANQTCHIGISLRAASGGNEWTSAVVVYADSAGNAKAVCNVASATGDGAWHRHELSIVVPSGMHITKIYFNQKGSGTAIDFANPTLSYGSAVCLASSAHTPYATQDHLRSEYATKAALKVTSDAVTAEVEERGKLAGRVGTLEGTTGTHTSKLQQLAASITSLVKGESTYTDPDGASATSGIYSLVTQTMDSVTALFGSYTKTADLASTQAVKDAKKAGTDAQAAASAAQTTANSAKSTAQTAASDAATAKTNASAAVSTANAASSTASSAKSTADSLATLIRADSTGITVGKSADGQTWSTGRTRMTADAFEVLTKAGEVASSFGEKLIELGKNSQDAVIRMLGGLVTIKSTRAGVSDGAWCEISTDEFVSTNGYHASRIAAGYKDETGFTPQGVAEVMVQGGEGDGGVMMYAGAHGSDGNSFAMSPASYTLNHPEYMLSALGLGAAETYQADTTDSTLTYDSTTVLRWGRVCVMPIAVHYTSDWAPSEYAFFTLPEEVRPSVEQRGTVTSCPYNWTSDYRPTLVSIGTDGKVKLSGPVAGHWLGQLVWVV